MGGRGVKRSAFLIGTRDRKGPGGHAEQPGHLQPQQLRSLAVLPPALRMGTGTRHHRVPQHCCAPTRNWAHGANSYSLRTTPACASCLQGQVVLQKSDVCKLVVSGQPPTLASTFYYCLRRQRVSKINAVKTAHIHTQEWKWA